MIIFYLAIRRLARAWPFEKHQESNLRGPSQHLGGAAACRNYYRIIIIIVFANRRHELPAETDRAAWRVHLMDDTGDPNVRNLRVTWRKWSISGPVITVLCAESNHLCCAFHMSFTKHDVSLYSSWFKGYVCSLGVSFIDSHKHLLNRITEQWHMYWPRMSLVSLLST